jgi:hypothetical protein
MIHILDHAHDRECSVTEELLALGDASRMIGAVSRSGVVFDADGVQIGVIWPGGEVVDLRGVRIGWVRSAHNQLEH